MDLAFLGIERLEAFILVFARTAGIFTLTPIFGSRQTPVQARVAGALGIALVFVPMYSGSGKGLLAADALPMVLLVLKEALVGLAIGFVTSLVFAAIQAAGELIDMHAGFSFAAVIDPTYNSPIAIAGRLHNLLAGMLFFVTNAHHIVISGLADSFRIIPIGQVSLNPAAAGGVVDLLVTFFAVALRIAAPVVAAVFLADIALVLVARVVPQMNVLMVGFPLKLGVGIVGMLVALPVAAALSSNALGDIGPQTAGLLRLLAMR
jgi:flagellar biosynthesis protein FliR